MYSSQIMKPDLIFTLFQDNRTVFRLKDIAMLTGETDFLSLNKRINYQVSKGRLNNPRKGIYTKPDYNPEELACSLYTPSYISLEYVLQKAGVIFQYDTRITALSYLNRKVEIGGQVINYRKMKGELLINTEGILRQSNHVNIATPERAFVDILYLNGDIWLDHTKSLNKNLVTKIVSTFQSARLSERAHNILKKW